MDISITLLVALIGALGGAVATGMGAWFRNRRASQSAARLIHAELTENTAPVRYFRTVGSWPPSSEVRHKAWDQYGVTLSKMRRADAFHAIQKGYSALEGITFISRGDESSQTIPSDVLKQILDVSIEDVRCALERAGTLAGIAPDDLSVQLQAMEARGAGDSDRRALVAAMNAGAIPASTLDAIARTGTTFQIESATKTLETMEARLPPQRRLPGRKPNRTIYDAKGQGDLDAPAIARREGDPPTGDAAIDDAYDGLGAAYDFFSDIFDRDSLDGAGQPLMAVVHFQTNFNNMFWDGSRLVAGDGDGQLFKSFTSALELVAHEVSFGVVQAEAQLNYSKQPGALTQSIADVFGVLVKQYKLNQTADEADWLIGAGVLGPGVKGVALRSMKAPGTAYDDPVLGKDPQPAHMDGYVQTDTDNGGIHTNAGIPNHAFYSTAIALGEYAWERAGRIWYEALRDPHLRPTTQFRTFARATRSAAIQLYGEGSKEVEAVEAGWKKVGVDL